MNCAGIILKGPSRTAIPTKQALGSKPKLAVESRVNGVVSEDRRLRKEPSPLLLVSGGHSHAPPHATVAGQRQLEWLWPPIIAKSADTAAAASLQNGSGRHAIRRVI